MLKFPPTTAVKSVNLRTKNKPKTAVYSGADDKVTFLMLNSASVLKGR